jgi:hypothetical protein
LGSIVITIILISFYSATSAEISGERQQWHKVILTFNGPASSEQAPDNPFLNYRMSVTFSMGTETYVIQGFYAADGEAANSGAESGDKWRCYFVPSSTGEWKWTVSFRKGKNIALNDDPTAGEACFFDRESGYFNVGASDKIAPDIRAKGMLKYVDGHYLQFAQTKEFYLKGGADSPENFLAYDEIDGSYDADVGSGSYSHIGGFIHQYKPHLKDWQDGDPVWQGSKGKGIVGALNYLAGKGMNSVYFLTYNLDGGDGRDTWMWTDVDERERFDCSKLGQWEIIFDHMDHLGIMLHVVTQETENDMNLGGSVGMNPVRKLYYRELIARFSHHLALIWNLGEENNTPDVDRKEIAAYIRNLDPYDHPITVHTHVNKALEFYDRILGDDNFEATSIQGDMANYHRETVILRQRSAEAGRKWAIFCDEQSEASHGVVPDANDPTHDLPRKLGLWGNLMGGGAGVEWYFGHQFPHMDINCEDWRSRDIMWDQTRFALEFYQTYLPFWEMLPADHLISTEDTYCFAKEGEVYAIYLRKGGSTELNLGRFKSEFEVKWYNPRTGKDLHDGSIKFLEGPGKVNIGNPPQDIDKDWAVLIRKINDQDN